MVVLWFRGKSFAGRLVKGEITPGKKKTTPNKPTAFKQFILKNTVSSQNYLEL